MQEKAGSRSILKLLLFVISVTFVLGQFSALYQFGGSKLYLFDLLISFFVLYGLSVFLIRYKTLFIPVKSFVFISFLIYSLLVLVLSLSWFYTADIFVSFYYLARIIMYFIASVIVFNMFRNNIIGSDFVVNLFIYSAVGLSLMGFIQLFILPDFTVLDPSLGWDPHKNRLASTFFDPNFAGTYISLSLAVLLFTKNKIYGKSMVILILLVALLLTFSRSAWLMFGFVVFVYGLTKNFYILILSVLLAFSSYYAVPRIQTRLSGIVDPADSASLRIKSWAKAYNILGERPITGWGYNNYRLVQKEMGLVEYDDLDSHSVSGSDSSLLLLLATTGVIGTFLFGISVFNVMVQTKNDYVPLLISVVGGIFINSQFINSLFYPQIMFWWMICLFSFPAFDKQR